MTLEVYSRNVFLQISLTYKINCVLYGTRDIIRVIYFKLLYPGDDTEA